MKWRWLMACLLMTGAAQAQPQTDPARVAAMGYCFGGTAVHAFAVPTAGHDNSKGAAYNECAARRSWQAMKDFFAEIFS